MPPLGVGEDKINCKFAASNNFSARNCYLESMRENAEIWEDKDEETVRHLLLHCPVTAAVWNYFIKSAGIQWAQGNDILDVIKNWEKAPLSGRANKIWKLIPFAIWWSVDMSK
ncbi:hypothetical protein BVC80_8883g13 [Macleaya cordata]|uniref:Reverse transcriptase zinc-binding domain n=1 Tax=Macleaya cordata TaxID=56857 RepID=A0A200Q788_MACCD|nr:hypothetical protein BVC80_8883g13 [Macleaya cordata]